MPDLIERVVRLEERTEAHVTAIDQLRVETVALRADMAAFRAEVRADIAALRDSFDRRFTWLVGIQVAGLVAVIAALLRNA